MSDSEWTGVRGKGPWPNRGIILASGGDGGNARRTSVKIADVPTEIPTKYLPNKNLERYL
jgi:hypothetical protein